MTDEEKLAEEYAKSIVIFDRDFHNERFAELTQAFLAGLKAGRSEWHKVDEKLPPLWEGCERTSIRVVDNYNRIITYDYNSKRWRDLEGDSLGIQADYWCEIPQFKE